MTAKLGFEVTLENREMEKDESKANTQTLEPGEMGRSRSFSRLGYLLEIGDEL